LLIALDLGDFIPETWMAVPPPMLHLYGAFYKPKYGSTMVIPRSPTGLYEAAGYAQDEPAATSRLWSDVDLAQRLEADVPVFRLPSLIAALHGQQLAKRPAHAPGVVDILSLHGVDYAASSNLPQPTVAKALRCMTEPGYVVGTNGAVFAGGIPWHNLAMAESARLIVHARVVAAALKAIAHDHHHHTLSFERCVIGPRHNPRDALLSMAEVLRHNTSLTSIAFPRYRDPQCNLWREMTDALAANPFPLFTSIDASECNLSDQDMTVFMSVLLRLFDKSHRGLSPVALKFEDNALTEASVRDLCSNLQKTADLSRLQVLSFAGNTWATASSCEALLTLLRSATALRVLNVMSGGHAFPLTKQLAAVLTESPCPLEEFRIGGFAAASVQVCVVPHTSQFHTYGANCPAMLFLVRTNT
jgi:hypothetical protein